MSLIILIIGFAVCVFYLIGKRRRKYFVGTILQHKLRSANRGLKIAEQRAELLFLDLPLEIRVIALSGRIY